MKNTSQAPKSFNFSLRRGSTYPKSLKFGYRTTGNMKGKAANRGQVTQLQLLADIVCIGSRSLTERRSEDLGVSRSRGTFLGFPINEDYSTVGSILGQPYLGTLQFSK